MPSLATPRRLHPRWAVTSPCDRPMLPVSRPPPLPLPLLMSSLAAPCVAADASLTPTLPGCLSIGVHQASHFEPSIPWLLISRLSTRFDASNIKRINVSAQSEGSNLLSFQGDICTFADKWVQGRIMSVLEGGDSDKAVLSGAMALVGMIDGCTEKETDQSRETP